MKSNPEARPHRRAVPSSVVAAAFLIAFTAMIVLGLSRSSPGPGTDRDSEHPARVSAAPPHLQHEPEP